MKELKKEHILQLIDISKKLGGYEAEMQLGSSVLNRHIKPAFRKLKIKLITFFTCQACIKI